MIVGGENVGMSGMPWPKVGTLIFLLICIASLIVSGVQKLRDREVDWKWSDFVSQRDGQDPVGYWLSTSVNFVFAAGVTWLAFEIAFDRIPVTWGR
jgi:hypothetical protein